MNQLLTDFEATLDIGSKKAARLLGVAYPTYAAYRSGARVLPEYHANHIEVILLLDVEVRTKHMERKFNGSKR